MQEFSVLWMSWVAEAPLETGEGAKDGSFFCVWGYFCEEMFGGFRNSAYICNAT